MHVMHVRWMTAALAWTAVTALCVAGWTLARSAPHLVLGLLSAAPMALAWRETFAEKRSNLPRATALTKESP